MKVFKFLAARITDGETKVIEVEARTADKAEKKFKELYGAYWVGTLIK